MTDLLPQAYLLGLIVLLAGIAVVIGRQILRVRRDERIMAQLGTKAGSKGSGSSSEELYTLASVQLRKRLYGQAADNLRKALRQAESETAPQEAMALIQNALGFSLAAQDNYQQAVRHYRAALKARADYPVALNNLAFALEKLKREGESLELYRRVLQLEAGNRTASKRLRLLERRGVTEASPASSGTGMAD
ncbi:MAG: tetratricopeptide repeat protein [Cyanobium sp.]|jgi:tetratricopeptide (TPR) repeat protein|nr:tetratricopeptide repeat protein [Synechococcaceae cyanobacterium]